MQREERGRERERRYGDKMPDPFKTLTYEIRGGVEKDSWGISSRKPQHLFTSTYFEGNRSVRLRKGGSFRRRLSRFVKSGRAIFGWQRIRFGGRRERERGGWRRSPLKLKSIRFGNTLVHLQTKRIGCNRYFLNLYIYKIWKFRRISEG